MASGLYLPLPRRILYSTIQYATPRAIGWLNHHMPPHLDCDQQSRAKQSATRHLNARALRLRNEKHGKRSSR